MGRRLGAPRTSRHGKPAGEDDDRLPADPDPLRPTGRSAHLHGDPSGPTLEIALLCPEPRDTICGGEHPGLPQPHADRRVRGPGREILRDAEVRDEVATMSERPW